MSYASTRERQTAQVEDDRSLSCAAKHCPNIWSNSNSKLCRWHEAASPESWPRITEELQDLVAERARERGPRPQGRLLTTVEKTQVVRKLRAMTAAWSQRDPRQCYRDLRAKLDMGQQLGTAQRHMLAEAESRFGVGEVE
jgi:hypothetical protein